MPSTEIRDSAKGKVIPMTTSTGALTFSATNTGTWISSSAAPCTFEAILSNTTTPAATVEIHGSNNSTTTPGSGTLLGTITLSGASDVASFTAVSSVYAYKCAKVTAISGTNATVTVTMGV